MHKCCTDFDLIEYMYEWKIKEFPRFIRRAEYKTTKEIVIKSPSFTISASNISRWHLEIHLYGSNHINKDYFGIFLCREDNMGLIRASQKYSIINAKGETIHTKSVNTHEFTKHANNWEDSEFCEMSTLLKHADIYIPNSQLTIVSQLTILNGITNTSVEIPHVPDITQNDVSNDFAKLLRNNKFCDVTFHINNKKIEAHRAILSVRSSVFSAMFKHPLQEQNSNVVTIDDVKPEIFEAMLEYIYTNNVIDINRTAIDLLPVADKYDLKELLKLCEMSLCNNVTVGNAAEIYILADRHNLDEVLEYMQQFMSNNLVGVMTTLGYQTMEKDHSQLTVKFWRKMMTKSCNK